MHGEGVIYHNALPLFFHRMIEPNVITTICGKLLLLAERSHRLRKLRRSGKCADEPAIPNTALRQIVGIDVAKQAQGLVRIRKPFTTTNTPQFFSFSASRKVVGEQPFFGLSRKTFGAIDMQCPCLRYPIGDAVHGSILAAQENTIRILLIHNVAAVLGGFCLNLCLRFIRCYFKPFH